MPTAAPGQDLGDLGLDLVLGLATVVLNHWDMVLEEVEGGASGEPRRQVMVFLQPALMAILHSHQGAMEVLMVEQAHMATPLNHQVVDMEGLILHPQSVYLQAATRQTCCHSIQWHLLLG